ncbi:hypothetical protein [Sphingosinicella rhizophila]|uniref:CopL family metal-binding regulatory protein n=1 Tax=Sphingosinicella rhizophila TaxID=3050082 RepID=A0ABU3QBS9_9SPHN|nr:hypothetical protein [Sphingosinicella sp. GR2756]MDT9600860.1 hypothetical protein [Sphingosinicella sp. GR2756]
MMRRSVATFRPLAYLPLMLATRLMRIMTIMAVLLAPLGMIGGTSVQAATHHPASATTHHAEAMPGMDHCAGMQKGDDKSKSHPAQQHDCMMACAAIPSFGSDVPAKPMAPSAIVPIPLARSGHGLNPEAATPPPRFA